MNIQCISTRPNHVDVIYGTGPWGIGEIKDVPDVTATKMLKHADVYVRPETDTAVSAPVAAVTPQPEKSDEEPLQAVYDFLQNATSAQLKSFIQEKYNVTVSAKEYPTVDKVRAYARQLVDQYGGV